HFALAEAHASEPIPQLGLLFPAALNSVMAKAMAKQPEERYSTATEFAAAFREAAGVSEQKIELPQLEELLEESLTRDAPQPLAEAVAVFRSARNAHQAKDGMVEIFRVAVRYVGLLSIACCAQVGSKTNSMPALTFLRNLHRNSLSEEEWIELARELCRPFMKKQDGFPVPELVSLFFNREETRANEDLFERLLEMQKAAAGGASSTDEQVREMLAKYLPHLAALLREISFLSGYS